MMDFVNEGRAPVNQASVKLYETGTCVQASEGLVCVKDAAYGNHGEFRGFDDERENLHGALADGHPAEAAGLEAVVGDGGVIDGCVGCDQPGKSVRFCEGNDFTDRIKGEVGRNFQENRQVAGV
jgi:hypothetical protein